ncbi:hypothetical protein GCM10009868_00530 [Terrabacter aerolatus]|uniref:DUF805 domain-containing protein n=1 Tax=Terrabacter aerolatus TaxID=422442 RepID=A0A512D345_9MICO|nr:DUF805 domain-containing protein [Terrabacter aerolatus]GEO30889.1 hypothetical protein TAE01_26990 [Terrabacter aerolatus]
MSFGEAVRTVYTQKYATFSGRARRSEYWWVYLFNTIVAMVLNVLTAATHSNIFQILVGVFALAAIIPGLAVAARRLHDTGRSGWWILIGLIPLVGAIVLLVFLVGDSQPGPNAYGPPVKNVEGYPVTA